MKEMVLEDRNAYVQVDQLNFVRNSKDWNVRTETGKKTVSNTFNKRQILEDMCGTIPYGYKNKK